MIWFEKYEILEVLGKGAFGQVFAAKDIKLHRKVAIKIVEPVSESFYQEAYILKSQKFKIMPVLYDMWEEKNIGVLIMEYIEGLNGRDYIETNGPISVEQAENWGRSLAETLHIMHQMRPKILYRDLKPENIIIESSGEIRLIDAGTAFSDKNLNRKKTKYRIGTYGYASPEQWNMEDCDERADIYMLGAILYDFLQGQSFEKTPYLRFCKQQRIPDGIEKILHKCIQKNKNDRYPNMIAFMKDFKNWKQADKKAKRMLVFWYSLKYIFLLVACYIVWYNKKIFLWGCFSMFFYCLVSMIYKTYKKKEIWWFQEKSVWFYEG